jgi:hypothetical protein
MDAKCSSCWLGFLPVCLGATVWVCFFLCVSRFPFQIESRRQYRIPPFGLGMPGRTLGLEYAMKPSSVYLGLD